MKKLLTTTALIMIAGVASADYLDDVNARLGQIGETLTSADITSLQGAIDTVHVHNTSGTNAADTALTNLNNTDSTTTATWGVDSSLLGNLQGVVTNLQNVDSVALTTTTDDIVDLADLETRLQAIIDAKLGNFKGKVDDDFDAVIVLVDETITSAGSDVKNSLRGGSATIQLSAKTNAGLAFLDALTSSTATTSGIELVGGDGTDITLHGTSNGAVVTYLSRVLDDTNLTLGGANVSVDLAGTNYASLDDKTNWSTDDNFGQSVINADGSITHADETANDALIGFLNEDPYSYTIPNTEYSFVGIEGLQYNDGTNIFKFNTNDNGTPTVTSDDFLEFVKE